MAADPPTAPAPRMNSLMSVMPPRDGMRVWMSRLMLRLTCAGAARMAKWRCSTTLVSGL